MPISHAHRCIFVHIPKCAGTSIEATLGMHGGNPRVGLELNLDQTCDREHLFGAGAQHLSARELRHMIPAEVFASYFKFTFVRNPWERLVSYVAWRELKWRQRIEPSQAEFDSAVWGLVAARLLGRPIDPHLRPQLDYISDGAGRVLVDFVGKVEDIDRDWQEVERRLGQALPLERRMQSAHLDYRRYYNISTTLAVFLVYWRDVVRLGYAKSLLAMLFEQ